MSRFRNAREKLISEAEEVLAAIEPAPDVHRRHFRTARLRLRRIRSDVEALAPLYDDRLAAPPIDRAVRRPGAADDDPEARARAAAALKQLQSKEGILQGKIVELARAEQRAFDQRSRNLETIGYDVRLYTLGLGAIAVVVGLLITLWGALTLRPLQRLRNAAQQIARGDYASRIHERGPSEVAELAHDFNVMGRAIEERERELVRSERLVAVGKMAAMITHEVRNPLSSIGLNTELLEEELADLPPDQATEARSLCRSITTEVDRLTAITEEYLQFARLPQPKLSPEAVDRLVQNLVNFEREQMALRGVDLRVTIDDELPLVMVDEGQLRQSLLNLLRNAGDAVEEVGGGAVRVAVRAAGDRVEISVEDEGAGISPELLSKLFEPFFSTKDGGTGLGLALTHQIIHEHGGEIRVDSEPGHGARFTIALPLTGPEREREIDPAASS
jgi:signal transduction histidine kinase